ncbi:uncharacterized protein TRIADDRAFT_58485 [Trichoplax adhaerens]|uniref:Ig-like domain-containing protein n=1 Tax=Trichoplax adhaerens TaxID=10228 RepID=B3S2U6_TRIAD|nr:predicted protein [Trichoplax adhaerens]EDV22849.1 predicted protein [Trichoplax adhaerens]|eukprot:XP_002114715.1 predicted protein [Trichoplax adhaerens]
MAHRFNQTNIVACRGPWAGHISNASNLCGKGWNVCSWKESSMLKQITWNEATTIEGCYAYDASQDGGTCKPCISDHWGSDDLAAVGKSCQHQNLMSKSCIGLGKIDASCCVDSLLRRACTYRPGIASGVLCCKKEAIPSLPQVRVIVDKSNFIIGENILLVCQVSNAKGPLNIAWLKDKTLIKVEEINKNSQSKLSLNKINHHHNGEYTCLATNDDGTSQDSIKIRARGHQGCAAGDNRLPRKYYNISACPGRWKGHIKNGGNLCGDNFQVCSIENVQSLNEISWKDLFFLEGCFSYDATHNSKQCLRCKETAVMAGLGRSCQYKLKPKGCSRHGYLYSKYSKKAKNKCTYNKGSTTGVMCCRIPSKKEVIKEDSICYPACQNGGYCIDRNSA